MKYLFFALFLGLGMVACKHSHDHSHDATEASSEVDQSGPEYTSAFICPMHCKGSGSAEAGNCPVCGMAYVANEEHKADGHTHDEDGEDHDDHDH